MALDVTRLMPHEKSFKKTCHVHRVESQKIKQRIQTLSSVLSGRYKCSLFIKNIPKKSKNQKRFQLLFSCSLCAISESSHGLEGSKRSKTEE